MVRSLKPIKFVCSYGGKILPRYPDGKLRYHGGETRVLSVDSSVSFSELLAKMGEMTRSPVNLRCQLPTEDLDALVSITSDEDLANLIEEYDFAPKSYIKIRAFLFAPKSVKKVSPPPSSASAWSSDASPPKSAFYYGGVPPRCPISGVTKAAAYPRFSEKGAGRIIPNRLVYQYQSGNRNGCLVHLIHNGNHWQ